MEPPAKRIKLEADIEPTLSALPTVDISANSNCEADLSFEVKAELKPHCSQCNLIFHSDAEHAFHISNWHYTHLCKACDKGFPDRHSFDAHRKTHPRFSIKCLGCKEKFKVHSAMVEHLESSKCTSGANAELLAKASDDYMNQRIFKSEKPSSSTLDPTCSGCGVISNTMSQVIAHLENRTCSVRAWLDDYKPLFEALQQRIAEQKADINGCTVCHMTFINAHALEQHLRVKHKLTQCFGCLEVFEMTGDREHNAVHRAVAPPVQITKEQMKQHPQENEKNPDLQSFYCSWTTDDEDQLRIHNIFCNSETKRTWCDLCKKRYSSARCYLQHVRDSPKHFTCDLCVEKMSTKGRREVEHNSYTLQYVSWEALATHMRESHAACISCNRWFVSHLALSDREQLKEHNEIHHWSEPCTACDLTFPDTRSLEEHKTTHPAEPIDCLSCSKTFGSYSLMMERLESGNCNSGATHEFIKQSIKDPFKDPKGFSTDYKKLSEYFSFCPVCSKELPRLSLLLQHYESRKCWTHGWQKLTPVKQMFYLRLKRAILAHIECVTCDNVFKDQRTWNEHMWKEHQERYCFLCKDDFSQRTWSTHFGYLQEACPEEESWHGKREPKSLACKDCGPDAIFGSDREFYNHCWKEHSTCAVCAVTYNNTEDLSKHDAKVHGKCGICGHLAKTYWDLRTHCTERHGIKLPLRPETPPESLKELPEANSDRPIQTQDSDTGRRPMRMEETSIHTNPQAEQGLITEWFNA